MGNYERGDREPSRDDYIAMAAALKVSPSYLQFGEVIGDNIVEGPEVRGLVPLVSWVQAGHWSEIEDPYALGDAEDWIPAPKKMGPRAFALRVRGESMFNPGAKHSFSDGEIIFVDPDYPANHGSFVVVRIDDENEATFKQLIREGATSVYLRAINPAWPNPIIKVDGDATICGVCRGKYVEF